MKLWTTCKVCLCTARSISAMPLAFAAIGLEVSNVLVRIARGKSRSEQRVAQLLLTECAADHE